MSTLNGGESEGSNRNWILRAYRQKNVRALPLATKGHPVFDPPCVLEGHSKTGFCSGLAPMTAPTPDNQRKWLSKTVPYRIIAAVYTNVRAKIHALAPVIKSGLMPPWVGTYRGVHHKNIFNFQESDMSNFNKKQFEINEIIIEQEDELFELRRKAKAYAIKGNRKQFDRVNNATERLWKDLKYNWSQQNAIKKGITQADPSLSGDYEECF